MSEIEEERAEVEEMRWRDMQSHEMVQYCEFCSAREGIDLNFLTALFFFFHCSTSKARQEMERMRNKHTMARESN